MKLQKQVSRRVEDREYSKYVVVVPPDEVDKLGWKEGQELEHEVKEQTLLIHPSKKSRGAQGTR
jgi:antitoxin component of MazEF toxin-antitoxin module